MIDNQDSGNSEDKVEAKRLPEWLRRSPGSNSATRSVKKILRTAKLNTVCEEARCPNIAECFGRGTATFMILGDVCTRGCRFCSVNTGKPSFPQTSFQKEAESLAEAAEKLNLKHVVVTSVARDDLADGGASGFAASIRELRKRLPNATLEVLIPDFRGNTDAVKIVADAGPEVLNHNLETVPRLYRRVRPGAQYKRSLELLQYAKSQNPNILTKTGIMLGLGEKDDEVRELIRDVKSYSIDAFTAGQYLQPTRNHLDVADYVAPERFEMFSEFAQELGIKHVVVGPLARSSYYAERIFSDIS